MEDKRSAKKRTENLEKDGNLEKDRNLGKDKNLALCPVLLASHKPQGADCLSLQSGRLFASGVQKIYQKTDGDIATEFLSKDLLQKELQAEEGQETRALTTLWRNLQNAPESFAHTSLKRPRIMGILNVTPDSFSDGGLRLSPERAIADGLEMQKLGAEFLDIGGMSTRPYAKPIPEAEECERVLPVVRELARQKCVVSVDTQSPLVMEAVLAAGAQIINIVGGLVDAPCLGISAIEILAKSDASIVLCHRRGKVLEGYQHAPYRHAPFEVFQELKALLTTCLAAGIHKNRIALDPGIGFGKQPKDNLALIASMALLHGLGCPLLLGASRKRFIEAVTNEKNPQKRLPGSLAAVLAAVRQGTQILRVHDVAETKQALDFALALDSDGMPAEVPAEVPAGS